MKALFVALALTLPVVLAAPIFEFDAPRATWFVRNDGVMGGVSRGTVTVQNGVLVFSGRIRLDNGGGFAGIRTTLGRYDLSRASGIVIRVRGDGKRYALQLGDNLVRGVTYRMDFNTVAGQWTEIRAPFSALRATRSGEFVRVAPLSTNRVAFFGFITRHGRAEPFRLEVDWIRAE
jgi:NADH dehydrogenase [ubiquinone] 1 alpha subcomplex assembly factor 1